MAALDGSWAEFTPDEKLRHRLDAWRTPEVEFASPEAQCAYLARVDRLSDAILMERLPDRVPAPLLVTELYPLTRVGLSPWEGMYDFDRASQAFIDFNLEFQPDSLISPRVATTPGAVFDLIDYRLFSWPGHGVPRDASFQYNEAEWMKAEEYDHLIDDPSDFMLRRYLPRVAGGFAGLARFGSALDPVAMTQTLGFVETFGHPEVVETLESLMAAGKQAMVWRARVGAVTERLQSLGFPPVHRSSAPGTLRPARRLSAGDARGVAGPVSEAGEGYRSL